MPKKPHPSLKLLDAFLAACSLLILAATWACRHAIPPGSLVPLPLAGIGTILCTFHALHAPDRPRKR